MVKASQPDLYRRALKFMTENTCCHFLDKCHHHSTCKTLCGASDGQLTHLSTDKVKVYGSYVLIHILGITRRPEVQKEKKHADKRQMVLHKTNSAVIQFTAITQSNGLLDAATLKPYRQAIVDAVSAALATLLSSTRRYPELGHILVDLKTILGAESVGILIEEMEVLPVQLVNIVDQLSTRGQQSDSVFFLVAQENYCESLTQITLNGEASGKHLFGRIWTNIVMEGQKLGDTSISSVTTDAVTVNVLGRLKFQVGLSITDDVIKLKTTLVDTKAKKSEVDKTYGCECLIVRKFVRHVIATAFPGHLEYDCRTVVSFCPEFHFAQNVTPPDDEDFSWNGEGFRTEWHISSVGSVFDANSRNQSLALAHEESPYSSLDGIKGLYAQNRSLSSNDNESLETATVEDAKAGPRNWSLDVSTRPIAKEFSHSEHKQWLGARSRTVDVILAFQEYISAQLPASTVSSGLGTSLHAEKSDALLENECRWTKVELGKALYDKGQMCKAEQLAEVKLELENLKKRRQPQSVRAQSGPAVSNNSSGSANGRELSGRCLQSSMSCSEDLRRNDDMNSAFSVADGKEENCGNEEGTVETEIHQQQNGDFHLNNDVVQPKSGGGAANVGLATAAEEREYSGSGAAASVQDKSTGDIGHRGRDCHEKDATEMPMALNRTLEDDPKKDGKHITRSSDGSFSQNRLCDPMAELSADSTDGNDQRQYHLTESQDSAKSEEFESFDSFNKMEDDAGQGDIDVVDGPASHLTHKNGIGGHLVNTVSGAEYADAAACSTKQHPVNTDVTSDHTSEYPCSEDSSEREWETIVTEPTSQCCDRSLNDDEGTGAASSGHTAATEGEGDNSMVKQLHPQQEDSPCNDFTQGKARFDPAREVVDSPRTPAAGRWPEGMQYSSKEILNDPREASAAKPSGNAWDAQGARPKHTQRSTSPPATGYGLDSGFMAKHSSFVALDSTSSGSALWQPSDKQETHGRLLGGALATDQEPRTGDHSRFRETAPREILKEESLLSHSEVPDDEFSGLSPMSMMYSASHQMSMRSLPVVPPSDSLPYDFPNSCDPREPQGFAHGCAGASNDPSAETSAKISEMYSLFNRMSMEKHERDRVVSDWLLARSERSKREQREKERKREKSQNKKREILDVEVKREPSQPARAPVQESPRWLCEHYQRRCKVRFPCCGKFYPCHRCHNGSDECSGEDVKALQATHIQCLVCKNEQEITEDSHTCKGCNTKMSDYFCPKCKHYTGVEKKPYHCEQCGICRIHKDRSFHCSVCNVCLDKRLEGKHKCRPDSGHDECCICLEDAFSGCQILPCSHKVHRDCAIAMLQNGVRSCPVCRHPLYKSASNDS